MKTYPQAYKSILPPLVCASLFAVASWVLFAITGPGADKAAAGRLNKLKVLQEQDRSRLGSYGWVDRSKGWVRIPISQAIKLEEQKLRTLAPHPVANSSSDSSILFAETPQ